MRLLLALLLLPVPVLAQEIAPDEASTWTPDLVMQYHSVGQTALSPTGDLVAYVVREPMMEGEASEYRSHIYVAATDGSFNLQFTRGEASCTSPAFSPDGQHLAFLSSRGDKNQVWVMHVRGGEARPLTASPTGVQAFQWAPDGQRVAFRAADEKSEARQTAEQEKRDAFIADTDFQRSHLYTVPFAAEAEAPAEAQRLTGGAFHVLDFDWAPDGQTLAFSHGPDPRINTLFVDRDISTVPADSGSVTPLVTRPGVDDQPRYSPDGQHVAFTSHGGQPEPVGLSDVYLVSATGGTPTMLPETPNRDGSLLDWTPDGQAVLVAEAFGTTIQVMAVPSGLTAPATDAPLVLPNLGETTTSVTPIESGTVEAVSLSADGQTMAFTYETSDTPEDVHVSPLGTFAPSQITDLHADVAPPPMGRTERIRWTSFDGMEIEGLLTYPVDYVEGERVPLVLQIHGGPAGVFIERFTGAPTIYMTQVFAQQGYAVLRPNPRGSTGYGKDFRYANIQDWGYGDYEDVMSGVDTVIERGIGHADSLAVMGWSYGGYLTSFLVTRTDRFKAASMGAGLPNLISMVTTTDIPNYLAAHMGGDYWDDYETYEKHSAVYHIANVVTPTQVIHGANDLRVPFDQGQEFYVALQRRGIATELVVLPRTPHGPREPKLLMDVTPRILTWFNHHLGRAGTTMAPGDD
ncbi:MAG: S9 family peptidase [Bacteroidota bacterium]